MSDEEATLFSPLGENLFGEAELPRGGPLNKAFVAPPVSVLDGRAGYWQERKAGWLALGIESEVGRGENLLNMSEAAQHGYEKEEPEHIRRAMGIYAPGAGSGAVKRNTGGWVGTSVFDPVICELAYEWWCPPGGQVLDPFAGGSVRGIVAGFLGRDYTGIELREEQVEANRAQLARIKPSVPPRWLCGDASEVEQIAGPGYYDFLLSCPPYGDLEIYSEDPRDLSTMSHSAFQESLAWIIAASAKLLHHDRFACFVVGDFRDPKTGILRDFVSFVIEAFRYAGLQLYNHAVIITPMGSASIRAGRIFRAARKLTPGHQNVLCFVKGDAKRAAKACAPIREEEVHVGTDAL